MNKRTIIFIVCLLIAVSLSIVVIRQFVQSNFPNSSQTTSVTPTASSVLPSPIITHERKTITIGDQQLSVEIADTPEKQTLGLSNRETLGSDGMLFIFPRPVRAQFWMIDMKFDLDFVWIYQSKVVEITPNVPRPSPNTISSELPRYQPSTAVDAMLEVNAGFAEQHGLQVGDIVKY